MGPVFEFFVLGVGARVGLRKLADVFAADPVALAGLEAAGHHAAIIKIRVEMRARLDSGDAPTGFKEAFEKQMALNPSFEGLEAGGPVDPVKHPLIAWLFTPQGIAFIFSIVSYVMSTFFHITIPPLPPLPTP